MTKRENVFEVISTWEKDGKRTDVITVCKGNENHIHAQFRGWNPFPCFTMETSWPVLREYLVKNNYIQVGKEIQIWFMDDIDQTTGEIVNHWEKRTIICIN